MLLVSGAALAQVDKRFAIFLSYRNAIWKVHIELERGYLSIIVHHYRDDNLVARRCAEVLNEEFVRCSVVGCLWHRLWFCCTCATVEDDITKYEDMGRTVIEGDPECEAARRFFDLADMLIAEDEKDET